VVDAVVVFDESTPLELIELVLPDVLVKGGDWDLNKIVGADVVKQNGGQVINIPLLEGYSTTVLIDKIRKASQ
jgi:D-glycero-beta-D-manno-heptose 1-phosphate adenylyltransferase